MTAPSGSEDKKRTWRTAGRELCSGAMNAVDAHTEARAPFASIEAKGPSCCRICNSWEAA